jgi:hypothetical protein
MIHPIEVYATKIEQLYQYLLDTSDEIEMELDESELDKLSRFTWIALAEQRFAEEHRWA